MIRKRVGNISTALTSTCLVLGSLVTARAADKPVAASSHQPITSKPYS